MQDKWWERKAEEIEHFADTKHSKMFFSTTPLLCVDGTTLLKEKENINDQRREHFDGLLNRPSTVDSAVLYLIHQKATINCQNSLLQWKR